MFVYTEIHAVLGEGNFVLTVSEGEWSGQTHAFYDLFRMDERHDCRALGRDPACPDRGPCQHQWHVQRF